MGPVGGNAAVVLALAHSELFGALSRVDLDRVASHCSTRQFAAGERIFNRGDGGSVMYLVATGAVALTVATADGGEITLAVLRPPQTFGELALIDSRGRIATATAREPTQLLCIPGAAVARLLGTKPAFANAMLAVLSRIIRNLDDQVADLVLLDLRGRVLKFLAKAVDTRDQQPRGALVPVDLNINQTELARLVGGSRQKVNAIVVDLERATAIHRRGSRIVAVNPAILTTLMETGGE